jgi:membrane fusion protein, multidrug efflux system
VKTSLRWWGGGAVVALCAGAALVLLRPAAAPKAAEATRRPESVTRASDPVRVETWTVAGREFSEVLSATGTLLAQEGVELQAESSGRVVRIGFREGTAVRKGDLLLKLNDAELVASRERASHRRELAAIREKRLAQLVRERITTQDDYDAARNELAVQDAELDLIQAQIAKTEVRAPFDGVVGLRYVSEGAFVNAATKVATLQQISRLKVDFSVPERYAARLSVGQPVEFRVAGSDGTHAGHVYAIDPRIDTTTRTVLVRAVCDNTTGRLLPGSFASVRLTAGVIPDAVLVPAQSVLPGVSGKSVYVVENGHAVLRTVETATRTADDVHIVAGLAPGDVIVVSGLQQLRDGLPVQSAAAAVASLDTPKQ